MEAALQKYGFMLDSDDEEQKADAKRKSDEMEETKGNKRMIRQEIQYSEDLKRTSTTQSENNAKRAKFVPIKVKRKEIITPKAEVVTRNEETENSEREFDLFGRVKYIVTYGNNQPYRKHKQFTDDGTLVIENMKVILYDEDDIKIGIATEFTPKELSVLKSGKIIVVGKYQCQLIEEV